LLGDKQAGWEVTLWYIRSIHLLACLSRSKNDLVLACWLVACKISHQADLTFGWLLLKTYFHPWHIINHYTCTFSFQYFLGWLWILAMILEIISVYCHRLHGLMCSTLKRPWPIYPASILGIWWYSQDGVQWYRNY